HVTGEAGVDEPGRGMGEEPEASQGAYPVQPGREVGAQGYLLQRGCEDELSRVQDERLVRVDLDQPCQVWLLDRRVDVWVLVVVEHPEVPVEPDVDAGGLDQGQVVGVDVDPPGVDLELEVTIRQQHPSRPPCAAFIRTRGLPAWPVWA